MLYIFEILTNKSIYYIDIMKMFSNIEFFLKSKTFIYLYKILKKKRKKSRGIFLGTFMYFSHVFSYICS